MISLVEMIDTDFSHSKEEGFFPLTQTFTYASIQRKVGRNTKHFQIKNDSSVIGSILLVEYPLFGKLVYWYAPYGPVLSEVNEDIIKGIKEKIREYACKRNVAFVRFDFSFENKDVAEILPKYFTKSPLFATIGAYFQPREEWFTNVNKSPEEILAGMHSKTRYSVRLAEKKGVTTHVVDSNFLEQLPVFLELMKKTALRNHFSLHGDEYYRHYFEEVEKTGKGFLTLALLDTQLLAIHFIYVVGDVAHYVFGASSDEHKDLCAPYLAHFDAMLEAKELGAKYYNFGAVSLNDQNKKWQGLSVFKQKFGGEVFSHYPLYDLILKPFWYYLYIARKLFKTYF